MPTPIQDTPVAEIITTDTLDTRMTLTPTFTPFPIHTATRSSPKVVITSPKGDETKNVDFRIAVEGTIENMPTGKKLWVFVLPLKANQYHPAEESVMLMADHQRWSTYIQLGNEDENHGESFELLVVLVSPSAEEVIREYIAEAKENFQWNGIAPEDLPDGSIEILEKITVTRK